MGSAAHTGCISAAKWQAPVWEINDLSTRVHSISGGTFAQKSLNSGGATGLCSAQLSPKILRALALKLRIKNALPFEDGYYKAIIHPDKVHELRSSSAFIDLHKYTESMVGVMKTGRMAEGGERGLVGVMEAFKFYESTEAPLYSTSSVGGVPTYARAQPSAYGGGRLYFTFFFGKNSYGVTDFDGGVRTFIKTPGPSDTSNPLDLYSTVGYRCIMTAKVLNRSACLWLVQGRNATTTGEG
jgi:N4-gp56 family major capsid protein